jgi:hypothetical protein
VKGKQEEIGKIRMEGKFKEISKKRAEGKYVGGD